MVKPGVGAHVRGILAGLAVFAAGWVLVWLFMVTVGVPGGF